MAVIDRLFPAMTAFPPGKRVPVASISACGRCEHCRRGTSSRITTGGWVLSNIDAHGAFGPVKITQALKAMIKA